MTAINLHALLGERAEQFAGRTALSIRRDGRWTAVSYAELSALAKRMATCLAGHGVQPGDRVAVLSESCPEWGAAFFACVRAGAAIVPLDVKFTEPELRAVLNDCAPRALLASARHAEMARRLQAGCASIRVAAGLGDGAGLPRLDGNGASEAPAHERRPDDVAVIVYTSGTTGSPKGVMVTVGNLLFQVDAMDTLFQTRPTDRFLSILPLNHLFELTGGFLAPLHRGASVYYAGSLFPDDLLRDLREQGITMMLGVPSVLATLRRGIERDIVRASLPERLACRGGLGLARVAPWRGLRRIASSPVRRRFGGRLRSFGCGGAPLERNVAAFFNRLGVPVLQGYGLTETSPIITINTLDANRLGSVGRPLPGLEVRIDATDGQEGEILTRGPHVMRGYYNRPDLTREVIDADGWLRTGDLGRLDADGFLHITGRAKSLIVLAGGKKVQPEEVESVLMRAASVKEVCVVGLASGDALAAGGEEVCAVVVPSGPAEREAIAEEFDRLGQALAPYKRPSKIIMRLAELPKTATGKVKRRLVAQALQSGGEAQP